MIKAILFDLNGTMIDDMHYHTKAWYNILNNDLNANIGWEDVKKEMYGKNAEVLVRIFGEGRFTDVEINKLSVDKEDQYRQEFFPHLKLIDGLDSFLEKAAKKNVKMAIASAAITKNVDFVLDNLQIREYFGAVVSADDVHTSKPHPESFLRAAALLGIVPEDCIVLEDAPKGVEAALNAGMQAVVLTTMHSEEEFLQYPNVVAFVKDYNDPYFDELLETRLKVSYG
jgi:beta-phosphoglucomutase